MLCGVSMYCLAGSDMPLLILLERNPLAAEFVRGILKRARIKPLVYGSETNLKQLRRVSRSEALSIIDPCGFPKPLHVLLSSFSRDFPNLKKIVIDFPRTPLDLCSLLNQGVHGFVSYKDVSDDLTDAVNCVARGHIWAPQPVLELYVSYIQKLFQRRKRSGEGLTPREEEIIGLLRTHMSNKEIASALGVSESTVKFHLARMFQKLAVHDRKALTTLITTT